MEFSDLILFCRHGDLNASIVYTKIKAQAGRLLQNQNTTATKERKRTSHR